MSKPRLCLALSMSLTIMQANLLPVQAQTESASIWQQLSDTTASKAQAAKKVAPTAVRASVRPSKKAATAAVVPDGHAMLFLKGKQSAASSSAAPAAALTIHPAISDNGSTTVADSDVQQAAPVAMENLSTIQATAAAPDTIDVAPVAATISTPMAAPAAAQAALAAPAAGTFDASNGGAENGFGNQLNKALGGSNSQQLLAQLAPDQVVAQGTDQSITATPIPPVVTGTVDLEEFKTTNVIDLKVAQSRTFKLKNKIVRTSISDPGVAEPVVVSENQLVLLGKTPGTATLVLWDDAGNSVAIDLHVTRDFSQLQSTLREIDPRIIVKAFSVGGTDRVILLGDVDHPDSVVRAFAAANVFMDDRGMTIQVANSRLINARVGEQGGSTTGGGGQTGQLAALSSVDRYTFFPNLTNNVSKAQVITSDGARVTSLVKSQKSTDHRVACDVHGNELNGSESTGYHARWQLHRAERRIRYRWYEQPIDRQFVSGSVTNSDAGIHSGIQRRKHTGDISSRIIVSAADRKLCSEHDSWLEFDRWRNDNTSQLHRKYDRFIPKCVWWTSDYRKPGRYRFGYLELSPLASTAGGVVRITRRCGIQCNGLSQPFPRNELVQSRKLIAMVGEPDGARYHLAFKSESII